MSSEAFVRAGEQMWLEPGPPLTPSHTPFFVRPSTFPSHPFSGVLRVEGNEQGGKEADFTSFRRIEFAMFWFPWCTHEVEEWVLTF